MGQACTLRGACGVLTYASIAVSTIAGAVPTEGQGDPARARVAAQYAAFWEGAGAPRAAAAFRRLAEAEGDRAAARALIARLRPAMARLAAERETDARAADLWARHAALCALPDMAGPR